MSDELFCEPGRRPLPSREPGEVLFDVIRESHHARFTDKETKS
jgi:hypothetical protein